MGQRVPFGVPRCAVRFSLLALGISLFASCSPLRLNLLCNWVLELPPAFTLAKVAGFGPAGALSAVVVSNSAFTLLAVLIFRRGKWKLAAA
jgi:Na+-driven multidrug efflux pump